MTLLAAIGADLEPYGRKNIGDAQHAKMNTEERKEEMADCRGRQPLGY